MKMYLRKAFFLLLCTGAVVTASEETTQFNQSLPRWEWNPGDGALANGNKGSYLNLSSGVDLWYTQFGEESDKTPVLILHGGTGNSNDMYHQANMLAKTRKVILQEQVSPHSTRGEGRSPYKGFTKFHYDDFTRDAIAVLDNLNISRVAVFGWSDGAITGLDLAMNYSSRIERVFAHGANIQANMSIPGTNDPIINSNDGSLDSDFSTNGTTYSVHGNLKRDVPDGGPYTCKHLSPLPERCAAMEKGVEYMWATEPTWGTEAMLKIKCPVWIVDGDHDIEVERNQADAMAAWIPFAGQLILPQVGHAALKQDPKFFNFALQYFMDMEFDGVLPYY